MITVTQKAIAAVVAVCVIAFVAIKLAGSYHTKAGDANEVKAQVIGAQADAMKAQAAETGAVVKADVAQVAVSTSTVAKVESERALMVHKWKERIPVPDTLPPSAPDDREILVAQLHQANELISKDQEDIEALCKSNADKDILIASLTKHCGELQIEADLREKQQLAQQAATDAWRKAASEGKTTGRIEGAAATVLAELIRLAIHK